MILVSAGFDGHALDPMLGFSMSTAGYGELAELLIGASEETTGLAHLALKIGNNLEELRAARSHLQASGVQIDRTIDHRVAQSLYVRDPDGHKIELYVDADPSIWREDPSTVAHSEPLEL